MDRTPTTHLETVLAHAGCTVDPSTGAVVAPIHLATTFERNADGSYPRSFEYSRMDNPTRHAFENTLAVLEGGSQAAAFSSGMAAAMVVLQALKPGDHVIMPDDVYHGVRVLATNIFAEWGLACSTVDLSAPGALEAAMRPETRLVWVETPSNPRLKITDIAATVEVARQAGAEVLVDNTWATPLLQQPLLLGADLVLHSVTKYLSGHSDVLGGAIVARRVDGLFARIRKLQATGGAVMDPFSAWLAMRGMRSMAARMRVHCENARTLAGFLHNHPAVERVHYPSLADHPGQRIAASQMRDFGGMISVEVRGGQAEAMAVAGAARVFRRATSLGGTESLIEHRASVEAPPTQTPPNLLRLSIGLEHIDDLVGDLRNALGVLDA
ncbi:MAG: PLP-dependent transferase [Rhodothermales bacterium]